MCNPPFFTSMEEAGQNPATAFSGTAAEMVCPGGELAFVTRMVSDSLALQVLILSCTLLSGLHKTSEYISDSEQRHKGLFRLHDRDMFQVCIDVIGLTAASNSLLCYTAVWNDAALPVCSEDGCHQAAGTPLSWDWAICNWRSSCKQRF